MMRAVSSEFRKLLDLHPPAFVITEMEMEYVDLVVCKKIDEPEYVVPGGEVS